MNKKDRSWLQLYVDAMTERDPYKRLALIRELKSLPKEDESEELFELMAEEPPANPTRPKRKRSKPVSRHRS